MEQQERAFFYTEKRRGKTIKDVAIRRGELTKKDIDYEKSNFERNFLYDSEFLGQKLLQIMETLKGENNVDINFRIKIQKEKRTIIRSLLQWIGDKDKIYKVNKIDEVSFRELSVSVLYFLQSDPDLVLLDLVDPDKLEITNDGRKIDDVALEEYEKELENNTMVTLEEIKNKLFLRRYTEIICSDPGILGELLYDDDRFIKFLLTNQEKFKKESDIFIRDRLPTIILQSKLRLIDLAGKGLIPFDKEEISKRLEFVSIKFTDPLLSYIEGFEGNYQCQTKGIFFVLSDEDYVDIVVHEYLHIISGAQYTIKEKNKNLVNVQKVGVYFGKTGNDWFNEAVTERLNIESKFGDESLTKGRYVYERIILGYLYNLGLDEKMTLSMYFESYGDSFDIDENKHMLPKTREFFRHVNDLFGKGVFLKLHKVIRFIESKEDREYYKLMDVFISGLSQIEKPIQLSKFLSKYDYLLEN